MNINAVLRMIEHDPDYYPKSIDKETAILLRTITTMINASQAIEIGTHLGYGTLHIAQGMKKIKTIWTVDWKRSSSYFKYLSFLIKRNIKQIVGTSAALSNVIPKNTFVDLVFIDAGHTFTWVLHDVYHTLPYVHRGSCMIFHDALNYKAPGVHACTRLFHLINLFTANRCLDVLHLPTLMRKNNETSGVCIVRIKTANKFLLFFLRTFYMMLFRLNNNHYL